MAQRIFHESGQDGRSVLGMLAVQVERDPKTGATIVRSVTPVSDLADPQTAATVFDDGRKSIHAVGAGASAAQPSSEELGQILSAIDGVGMTALLDDVTISPTPKTTKGNDTKGAPEKVPTNNQAISSKNSSVGFHLKEKGATGSMTKTIDTSEIRQKTLVADSSPKVEVAESEMLCEGPVTLMFMGYTDGRSEEETLGAEEEPQGMLTAERVIITDDGEELVLGQESAAPPLKPPENLPVKDSAKESLDKKAFQDVPLDGKNERAPEKDEEKGQKKSDSIAEAQGKPKRKTCQCCTVM